MTANFTIPGRLPGMNEIINACKGDYGWYSGARQKKKFTEMIARIIVASRVPPFQHSVMISFDWYESNARRDVGNIRAGEKFISDALVHTRRIPDDSQKWVQGMSDHFHVDKTNPRIEVEIKEMIHEDNNPA